MKIRVNELARWIAVIPAAIAGLIVGVIFVQIITKFQIWWLGAELESGWAQTSVFIIAPAAGAALSVYWGSVVAPKARKVVSIIVGLGIITLNIGNTYGAFIYENPDFWWILGSGAASFIVVALVIHGFLEKGDDYKLL